MKVKTEQDIDLMDEELELVSKKFVLPKSFVTRTKKKNKKMRKKIKNLEARERRDN